MRVISLNLNGIRAAANKGLYAWLPRQEADLICLQELKAQAADLSPEMRNPPGYHGYFHYAEKKGYSGVGMYARRQADHIVEGLGMADIDSEGRYLELRYANLRVISLYLPSGSSSEERQAAKFSFMARFRPHLEALAKSGDEVILCGDWNIAHREIDLKNWKSNQKNSGCLPEERDWLNGFCADRSELEDLSAHRGWVDAYRALHPDGQDYTWWSNRGAARANNVGWRIDYQLVTPGLRDRLAGCSIHRDDRFSDHAPFTVDYRL